MISWRKRWLCWHHDRPSGVSWIQETLIDAGRRKMFWCERCGKKWFTP